MRSRASTASREPPRLTAVEIEMNDSAQDVFLLGAGFARAISPSMPLLQELAERVGGTLDDAKTRIPPEVRAMMDENFAHALSYLEQAKPWVTEADNLRHRALFLDISNAIARVLEDDVAEADRMLRTRAPEWLPRLVRRWHEQRCVVLTLNYDTLIERAAAHLPGAAARISAHDLYPPLLTDAALRSGTAATARHLDSFRLLKLHGSTNWYYSGRSEAHGEPIFFVPPPESSDTNPAAREQHEQRLHAVADKYPFLIPPIYDKSPLLTHETIRALWFAAGDALRRARRVVCMGYSLPASDLTMMHFLRTTCQRETRIEIVNQTAEAAENFGRLFRSAGVHVEASAIGDDCIADYVARLDRAGTHERGGAAAL